MMVTITQNDYALVLASLSAPLRGRLRREATVSTSGVTFGDDVAAEVYTEMMDYITLRELDCDYAITSKGRELERIAMTIFTHSNG